MSVRAFVQSSRPIRLLLLLTLAACLMGCSTFLEDLEKLAAADQPLVAQALAETQVKVEPTVQPLPEPLERCLKLSMRPRKAAAAPATKEAADALVLKELQAKRAREVCAYQLFTWFQEQRQKVQKVAGK